MIDNVRNAHSFEFLARVLNLTVRDTDPDSWQALSIEEQAALGLAHHRPGGVVGHVKRL